MLITLPSALVRRSSSSVTVQGKIAPFEAPSLSVLRQGRRERHGKQMAPRGAICSIVCLVVVVPVVIPNHDATVAMVLVMIPPAMPAPIVFVEPSSRTIVLVAVVITVAANVDANPSRIREGRSTHREG